ncbi:MAG TPA: hypothetical protein DDW19_05465 [Anaerolineaceae bacterium]|jgi:outer membrane protein assembly factor BamB|nr:hypothetical protein [Anaerolineaceae bacterium]
MKMKMLPLLSVLLLAGILLSACTSGASTASSWAGATLANDAIYFAGTTQVFALRPDNGNSIWSYPENGSASRIFLAAPTVSTDQVIAGDYVGGLVSLNAKDGSENWTFSEAKGKYVGSALATDTMIIAPNADGNLYALDLQGKLVWKFAANNAFWSQPVTDSQNVYASSLDHYLYAVDLNTGEQFWKADLGATLVSSPLLDSGVLYQGSIDGVMNAVDAATGKIKWAQKLDAGIWATPVLSNGKLYFGDQKTKIYILDAANGTIEQSIDVGAAVIGSGVLINDGIAFGTESGDLVMIGLDGRKLWSRTIGGMIYSNLVSNGTIVLVVETQGDRPLVALDTNGTEIWYFAGK